jgi:nucleoside-diphosphate-sugar epimerase
MLDEISEGKKKGTKLSFINGDTRNEDLLESSIKDFAPTYVLHMAELSSVYACNHNPIYTEDINFRASKRVIDICEGLGVKVLYNSTSSVYGTQREKKLMTEESALPDPTDYYVRFKLKMEEYVKEKKKKNPDFDIIVFRPATVFGISPRFRIELLPNHFTYMAISRKLIPISDLNAYRAAIDIDDLVRGYFKVIEKGSWKHLIYNIGHYNLSKRDFAVGIQKVVGCKLGSAPDIGDLRNLQIDCRRFEKEFGFKPKITYAQSIRKVSRWLEQNLERIESNNFAELLNMPLDKWRHICS